MEESVRHIFLVRDRRGVGEGTVAYSQRRAADRHIENIVKRRWRELTDIEAVGQRYNPELVRMEEYGLQSYEYQRARQRRDNAMETVRTLLRAGYRHFRRNYSYNYGDLPTIETIPMYRTVGEYARR